MTDKRLIETAFPLGHAAATMAGEQSTGTFVRVPGETDEAHFSEIVKALDGRQVSLDCSDPETGRVVAD